MEPDHAAVSWDEHGKCRRCGEHIDEHPSELELTIRTITEEN